MGERKDIGIGAKKDEDISKWFIDIITKADLIEYTDISGCYVFKPRSYSIWETVQKHMDLEFKKRKVKNAYFPLFIPEKMFAKEAEHVEGFTPEVAWVTHAGETPLTEKLAIRPTSETIMYDAYAKWIRSYKDLPLKINQWCNVVRWEFKNPVPFLRSREFLWQEGHTAFATKEEAEQEAREMLEVYRQTYEQLYAVPVILGRKTEKEKFAGADYTLSAETFLPTGKAIQGCTSHHLGQNFSKAFNIKFKDKNEKEQFVWQNSWGFTTRSIGVMIMMHSDDKGLIIPPNVATEKLVIVPIYKEDTKEKVMKEAKKIAEQLKDFSPILDEREDKTPGFKFNDWEMKGVPIRIELGPKDIDQNQVVAVKRNDSQKIAVKIKDLQKKIPALLDEIQNELFENAKQNIQVNTIVCRTWHEFEKAIESRKLVLAPFCNNSECEDWIKDKTHGAKSINIPFEQDKIDGEKCPQCSSDAKVWCYFAKSY
ncbi:MAG: proline--tRNA ligase [Candidatus Woesearchaeota archaeon]